MIDWGGNRIKSHLTTIKQQQQHTINTTINNESEDNDND